MQNRIHLISGLPLSGIHVPCYRFGDYDGNGTLDIEWQSDTGQQAIWLLYGSSPLLKAIVELNPGATWHLHP